MRKLKKIKDDINPQERDAVRYLSTISERQINQIWTMDEQHDKPTEQKTLNPYESKDNKSISRESINRNTLKKRLVKLQKKPQQITPKPEKVQIEVVVEDFACIPTNNVLKYTIRSQRKCSSMKFLKKIGYKPENTQLPSLSVPRSSQPSQISTKQTDYQNYIKNKQHERKLNELIRNKIRNKHSHKFILEKEPIIFKNQQIKPTITQFHQHQNSQIKILRNWLDKNRLKRKKSISALLNQHFQYRYIEQKRNRQRNIAMKSMKVFNLPKHV